MPKIACLTNIKSMPYVFKALQEAGEVYFPVDSTSGNARKTADGCDAIFTNPNNLGFRLDADTIPDTVRVICTASTGTDHIDMLYCAKKHIMVLSATQDYDLLRSVPSTAQHALLLTMALLRGLPDAMLEGPCHVRANYPCPGYQIDEHLTVGVVGFGRLGQMYADYCAALGARVVINDIFPRTFYTRYPRLRLDELILESDVVSLHVPLETARNLINEDIVDLMGTHDGSTYLVNTSRGGVVDEVAVVKGLYDSKILGYATDVLAEEPGVSADNPIISAYEDGMNVIITPHIGGHTREAESIVYEEMAKRLGQWLKSH